MKIDQEKRAQLLYEASVGDETGQNAMRLALMALDDALEIVTDIAAQAIGTRATVEAEIVAWLRSDPLKGDPEMLHFAADAIERGEHRKG